MKKRNSDRRVMIFVACSLYFLNDMFFLRYEMSSDSFCFTNTAARVMYR